MTIKLMISIAFAFVVGVLTGRFTTRNKLKMAHELYDQCNDLLQKIEIIKKEMEEICPIQKLKEQILNEQ